MQTSYERKSTEIDRSSSSVPLPFISSLIIDTLAKPKHQIGSSLGAIVLFEALLSLASTSKSNGTEGKDAPLVDSAIFISLPQAPSKAQWRTVRGVVGRRVVNA